MKNSLRKLCFGIAILEILGSGFSSLGQTVTATLTGVVRDQSGAVVSDAQVTAVQRETRIEYAGQSNQAGVYNLPFLPIGTYIISAEAAGFKKLVTNTLSLEVNQIAHVDLNLEVGAVTQTIEVKDVAPILQMESATVGEVISGTTIGNLPLNGRSFQQLTLLLPGTIAPDPTAFNSQTALARPYVNGNREEGNNFLLDGISVVETIDNRIGYLPNVDSIAEFRTETSNYSAAFGNVTGAVVNATMKSGTNDLHGNLFEFLRNDALDANSWVNNRNSTPQAPIGKAKLQQNIWGGTAGGPIVRNRVFFFAAYQDTQQRTGGPTAGSVAPAEWRRGDLSSIPTPIIDPRTGAPFRGNQIPVDRFSPTAKALFADTSLYPLPTRPGTDNIDANYATSTLSQLQAFQVDGKIDAKLSSRNYAVGRYSIGNSDSRSPKGALPTDITTRLFSRPQNIVLNWKSLVSPTIVNEARVGLNRAIFISTPFDWAGIGNADARLGIPGSQVVPGLSLISFGMGIGSPAQSANNVTNTFQYSDTVSLTTGKHSLNVGAQWLRYQDNRFFSGNNGLLGYFYYVGTFTGAPFADFLLDQLGSKGVGSAARAWGQRQNRPAVFLQDDYKLKRNLTLNLGMRWEYTSPLVEVKDRQANFDLVTGQELFAGRNGNSRALYKPYYRGFDPIVGFAWTPESLDQRLVIRGGYRITRFMEGTGAGLRLPLNPPFFSEANAAFDATSGPGTISKGFTDVIYKNQPSGLIRIWNPELRPQFTQQWNLTVERQLNSTTSISAGYVGHKATHLVVPRDWNQPLPGRGDPNTWLPLDQRRPLYPVLPLVTEVNGTDSSGTSDYHSLQIQARKRVSAGLEFLGSYTLGKAMTDSMGFFGPGAVASPYNFWANAYNRRGDRGLSAFDTRHSFIWSGTYDLPVGTGKRWGSSWSRGTNAVLGGWTVSSIITMHTGFPVTIFEAPGPTSSSLQDPRGGERPNRILGQNGKLANPSPDLWLNASAYAPHTPGVFGNAGNSTERAPGYANWDFAVSKHFAVSEGSNVEFRGEFFNFTNHPNLGPPSNNISDPVNFGKIFGIVGSPRIVEFALKVRY